MAIQRRLIAALGRRCRETGLRDGPPPAARRRPAPARLAALDLAPTRALALRRARARGRRAARDRPASPPTRLAGWRRLRAIPGIGPWTLEMLALHGRAATTCPGGRPRLPQARRPADDGNPRARADEAEVRGFFAPYGDWKGLAGEYLRSPRRAACSTVSPAADSRDRAPRPGRNSLVSARAADGGRLSSPFAASSARRRPTRPAPASPTAGSASVREEDRQRGLDGRLLEAAVEARCRPSAARRRPPPGRRWSSRWPRAVACRKRRSREAPSCVEVLAAGDEDQLVVGRHAELLHRAGSRACGRAAAGRRPRSSRTRRASRRRCLDEHRRHEVEADVGLLDRAGVDAGLARGSSSGRRDWYGMPAVPTRLPAQVLRRA